MPTPAAAGGPAGGSGGRRRVVARGALAVACPWCASTETERSAVFGPFHMSESYVCRACHSPFSRIKWEAGKPAPSGGRADGTGRA